MKRRFVWLVLLSIVFMALGAQIAAANLQGAIFTTTQYGQRVNANIYPTKEAVYLDGGPGQRAPSGAAALPEGDYYFQVTDPPGKTLLSADPIESRKVHVNAAGVIDKVYDALVQTKFEKQWWFTHASYNDVDHTDVGAKTVQLMPYKDTPNAGGVYKVWMTPVGKYSPGSGKWGFIPSESKTDNFKVKKQITPPKICVRKFHDLDADGVKDEGEPELFDQFTASYVDPNGSESNKMLMPYCVYNALPEGTWIFTEQMKDGWFQTCAYVDGQKLSYRDLTAAVTVAGTDKETHEIWFGNAEKGCLKVYKFRDHDLDGCNDAGEDPWKGVKFTLTGTDLWGNPVGPIEECTGDDGYAKFCGLLPGDYKIVETVPEKSFPTTDTEWCASLKPGETLCHEFGNAKFGCVKAKKFYDADVDGKKDEGEGPIAGIWFKLEGTTYKGDAVGPLYKKSGEDGCVSWCDLYPGDYKVTEILPPGNWMTTTDNPQCFKLCEGGAEFGTFGNVCWKTVDFNTKGFWHNKNGIAILAQHPEWIAYVNGLAPYKENPFDGKDAQGNPVPAAEGEIGNVAPAGTALAEISAFLVADNSDYKQLSQQLLAFIFNVKATGVSSICTPDGPVDVNDMIDSAIEAWTTGTDIQHWVNVLDCYNNNDAVKVIRCEPCPVPDYDPTL